MSPRAPQPEEIYAQTEEEGRRRLQRPLTELVATSLAAGFDIVVGVTLLGIIAAALHEHFGKNPAHAFASIGFGTAFVFLIVGRGELFTENFLVPLAGLERNNRRSWLKLGELWLVSPVFNILGAFLVILILTTHGVLPRGAGTPIMDAAQKIHSNHALALFLNAVFAGALITAMTWFVEGHQESQGIRVTVAWIVGAILALAGLNHVIVVTIELLYAHRFGADIPLMFILGNFGLATLGNMIGGIGLVTLTRFTQARAAGNASSSS